MLSVIRGVIAALARGIDFDSVNDLISLNANGDISLGNLEGVGHSAALHRFVFSSFSRGKCFRV